ncbi:MAG: polysaccharide pyruvyl transferase family protein [Pseudomonadota bacterium]
MTRHVAIFGHYGNGNLGDEAITEAAIQSARRLLNASRITLFSVVPEDSAQRHGLDAHAIRPPARFVPRGTPNKMPPTAPKSASTLAAPSGVKASVRRLPLIRGTLDALESARALPGDMTDQRAFRRAARAALEDVDLLIIAGSNQFLDNFGGTWGFPFTLLNWTELCNQTGTVCVFLSVGAGPITKPLSRLMVRRAIAKSHFHSYRDRRSLELIEGTSARLGGEVCPDLACNLDFPDRPLDYETPQWTVAINPMPVYGDYWYVQDPTRYRRYLATLATLAEYAGSLGHRVLLFPTQTRDMDAIHDLAVLLDERKKIGASQIDVASPRTTQDLMAVIQSAHVIVPTRFHGTILGLLAQRLVLSVCYQDKARDAMIEAGQGAFAHMLDTMDSRDLCTGLDNLFAAKDIALERIARQTQQDRAAVNAQYTHIARQLDRWIASTR